MILNEEFVQFCNNALLILQFSKFFGKILDSFELHKFWTHNIKAMLKDKKSQYHSCLSYAQLNIKSIRIMTLNIMAHRKMTLTVMYLSKTSSFCTSSIKFLLSFWVQLYCGIVTLSVYKLSIVIVNICCVLSCTVSFVLGRGVAVSYRAIFNEFVYLQYCKDIITNFAEEKTLNKVSISAQKQWSML
jgi:hypothetical protein